MKADRRPHLIGVWAVLLCAAVSSIAAQDGNYVATDLDDPLQPVWVTLDALPQRVSEAVVAAIRTEFTMLNTQLENKVRSLTSGVNRSMASVTATLRRLEQMAAAGGGTTDSSMANAMANLVRTSQVHEDHVIGQMSESVTKLERHIDTQVAALKEYIDAKLMPAPTTDVGRGGGRGSTEAESSIPLTLQTLNANAATLQNINEHVLKINEKLSGSSEGGDSCGTLLDKVSEMMSSATPTGGSGECQTLDVRTLASLGLPRDCSDKHWQEPAGPTGVYEVYPTLDPKDPVACYCDMGQSSAKDTGGWTVILRRRNTTFGLVNFNRTWSEYRMGFGDPGEGEWWFGLAPLHALTYRQPFEVDLLMHDIERGTYHAEYTTFRLEDEAHNYTLLLGGFTGNLTHDALTSKHNGSPFTTWDKDNDSWNSGNCGQSNGGGWWFNACHYTTLTAPFPTSTDREARTIRWLEEDWLVLDDVTMKIRPFNYAQRFNIHKGD